MEPESVTCRDPPVANSGPWEQIGGVGHALHPTSQTNVGLTQAKSLQTTPGPIPEAQFWFTLTACCGRAARCAYSPAGRQKPCMAV
jgi:hypothetical protein